MIRLSQGSAIELGLINKINEIPPTTAYVMIGEKCDNKCSFCSQSINNSSKKDRLSRIVWPEFSKEEILEAFENYKGKNIKRICIQSMYNIQAHEEVKKFIAYIKSNINIPISLSAKIDDEKEIEKYFSSGVDKIGIAIDVANKDLYEQIKGGDYSKKLESIVKTSSKYPDKISTHIIVGMGETHEEIHDLYAYLRENKVGVSLFAFTPVRGTEMENIPQPNISSYRQVQLMTYMIDRGYSKDYFEFKNGQIEYIKIDDKIRKNIEHGYPFEIRGCKDCNRPYYNERPGKTIYNYSIQLTKDQCKLALKELNQKVLKES